MNKDFITEDNGIKTNHTISSDLKEINADGVGPAMIGFPNIKFSLFQQKITPPNETTAEREIVATISIPTVAILELAEKIKNVIEKNKEQFALQVDNQKKILLKNK